jgi:hypothetical protein
MSRALRDPRIRWLVAGVIVLLGVALSWHLVAMGLHGMAMMLGLCLAVVAAAMIFLPGQPVITVIPLFFPTRPLERPSAERVEPPGRHPPDEGIRLRH